ncbi:MAG: protease modulator HflC [Planctomycetes bacterium]|nr:protease modulator HflC [Planctomycetota bacterium]
MSALISDQPSASPSRWLRALGTAVLLVLLLHVIVTSVLFVDETEFVIVETLGRIVAVYDRVDPSRSDRGLHLKFPWPVGTVRRFDRRQQLFDPPGREMFTRDKKNVTVSSYLCWKIADPPAGEVPLLERPVVKFFQGLGTIETAESRLEARVRSALEIELGQVELLQLLHVGTTDGGPDGDSPLGQISRSALDQLRGQVEAESSTSRLGIELVDLRIKRINLPEGNRQAVYERMRTERERIAERYRSAGLAEKSRIESQARRQSDELLARAEADAERIRGEGEADAIRILNRAHAQDPEFYEFQRTLATYSRVLSDKTTLVLSSGSRLFKLLTEGVPPPSVKPVEPTARKELPEEPSDSPVIELPEPAREPN